MGGLINDKFIDQAGREHAAGQCRACLNQHIVYLQIRQFAHNVRQVCCVVLTCHQLYGCAGCLQGLSILVMRTKNDRCARQVKHSG